MPLTCWGVPHENHSTYLCVIPCAVYPPPNIYKTRTLTNLRIRLLQIQLIPKWPQFSILLFTCTLALITSFKGKCSFEFPVKNEATRANLQENKEY